MVKGHRRIRRDFIPYRHVDPSEPTGGDERVKGREDGIERFGGGIRDGDGAWSGVERLG